MSQLHKPVLLNEVLDSYSELGANPHLVYFDGTYGRGGHFRAVQQKYSPSLSFITDQDETAIQQAHADWNEQIKSGKIKVFHQNFFDFVESNVGGQKIDMALLDLGVSSPQLDEADRGFSFNKDGPLDMRMNQTKGETAADIINTYDAEDLIQIFKSYGEVPNPARVVRAIVSDRTTKPFVTTLQLAGLIERVDGWQKKGYHPATQYFMALRLVINRELEVVENVLPLLIEQMQDKGRISVITFHSLEDRIVKNIFKDSTAGFLVNKKVIVPSEEECKINPRARSAKLRIFQKGEQPEKPDKFALRRAQRDQQ
ncbi:16S rRNA (cytosine(1402)-N(4))-methyltransferase RsmH [bacterium]|nr:16S rRNA (cytosine(1402)-N(4))-methyltransferase RsmH [bacterium]